eukprot:jgi/Botrbrau1/2873/Bobra.0036s0018.1
MRDIVRLDWNYRSTPGVYQSVANQSLTCICPCLLNNAQVGGHRLTPSVPPPCRIRQAQNISLSHPGHPLADLRLHAWEEGRDLYIDIVGSSPLTVANLQHFVPGRRACCPRQADPLCCLACA